ncbi:MAG: helix-turn-helix domain-containing protein, partial [Clostridiaceae bacterium]|nr:helix-turn-helix domain-containing protein [Clostridiaceae bacterium]
MFKYSYKEKLEAVMRVVDEGMSARGSAKILGTVQAVVQRWVARYKEFGTEGLILKQGSYTGDFKISVVEYMHDYHLSLFKTAIKFGIPSHTIVGKWERIYYEEGPQALYRDMRGRKSTMSSNKPKKKLKKQIKEDLIAENQ